MRVAPGLGDGRVVLIGDWNGPYTGIGRYWRMVHGGLREAGLDAVQVTPLLPPLPDAAHRLPHPRPHPPAHPAVP